MAFAIEIKTTKNKGRGVFAQKDFMIGEIIEICPVILITDTDYALLEKTILDNYMYAWSGNPSTSIPLGYGLLYNHSYTPNADYNFDNTNQTIVYTALKTIHSGEEILVNYNVHSADTSPVDMQDVHYGGPMIVKE